LISGLGAGFTAYVDDRKEVKIAFSDYWRVDIFFARKEKTPLESAVQSVAEWVRRYGARKSNTFENIEIKRNL
jgi:UDP-glucose 4-epimerase